MLWLGVGLHVDCNRLIVSSAISFMSSSCVLPNRGIDEPFTCNHKTTLLYTVHKQVQYSLYKVWYCLVVCVLTRHVLIETDNRKRSHRSGTCSLEGNLCSLHQIATAKITRFRKCLISFGINSSNMVYQPYSRMADKLVWSTTSASLPPLSLSFSLSRVNFMVSITI